MNEDMADKRLSESERGEWIKKIHCTDPKQSTGKGRQYSIGSFSDDPLARFMMDLMRIFLNESSENEPGLIIEILKYIFRSCVLHQSFT